MSGDVLQRPSSRDTPPLLQPLQQTLKKQLVTAGSPKNHDVIENPETKISPIIVVQWKILAVFER